jgi:transcriptional regulator with XRE-family HTH domain
MEINEIFSRNLRRIMDEKRYRAVDLVEGLGVSKQIVSAWMNGHRVPRIKMIDRIGAFLGCSREDLLGDKEKEPVSVNTDPQTEMIVKLISRLTPEEKSLAFDYLLSLIQGNQ